MSNTSKKTILINKSTTSRINSTTIEGEKAITRSFLYKKEGIDTLCIYLEVVYFSKDKDLDDTIIKKVGDKYVYKRVHTMILDTLTTALIDLGVIAQ